MPALSLAVHIPIGRFGSAFPAMMLFVHGSTCYTGDPDLRGTREAVVERRAHAARRHRTQRDARPPPRRGQRLHGREIVYGMTRKTCKKRR